MPNRCVATTAKLQKSLECSGLHASFYAVVYKRQVLLGVGGMIAVLVLLIVIMVVFHILRKRGIIKRKVRKHAGRHAAITVRSEPVKAWSVDGELSVEAHDGGQTSKEDSESVQETSSEQSDA